jgi:hypothetical protein
MRISPDSAYPPGEFDITRDVSYPFLEILPSEMEVDGTNIHGTNFVNEIDEACGYFSRVIPRSLVEMEPFMTSNGF